MASNFENKNNNNLAPMSQAMFQRIELPTKFKNKQIKFTLAK